jgi:CheY-like chemotaxis protein
MRRGFGTELIEHSLRAIEGADAQMRVESGGLSWHFTLPLPDAPMAVFHARDAGPSRAAPAGDEAPRQPAQLLVIEDEPIVGLDIVSSLKEGGYRASGPVGTLQKAIHAATTGDFAAALLDANLAGKSVDEIAAVLTRRNIPFTFVTGYGRDNLPAAFASAPTLGKPFSRTALLRAVGEMLTRDAVPLRGDNQTR